MANRQENQFLQMFRALFGNLRGGYRRLDEEQSGGQNEMPEFVRWRPPTEQSLPGWNEHKRQTDLQAQPGGYQYPQMMSGWLWKSHANQLLGGPHQETTGGQVQYFDPRRPSAQTYLTFTDYDQISKKLRDLAPDDKVVGQEDEERFRSAGIEFGGFIGGGSYGKVFHAIITQPDGTQKPCVVKRLTFADFKDKNRTILAATKSFVREMKVSQKIMDAFEQEERVAGRQPSVLQDFNKNIVGCNNIWRIYQEETQFPDPVISLLFLEVCDTDLKHVIENPIPNNTKLSEDDARKLFVQIGNALKWLHKHGIVHFDIKPDNIMIKLDPADPTRGQFKLGDFGLAEVFPNPSYMLSDLNRGTPMFKAPEVRIKTLADRRKADVFSLGATVVSSIVGFGAYKMFQGVLTAGYTFYIGCMIIITKDLNIALTQQEKNMLNSFGFGNNAMIAFFRHVCTEYYPYRALMDQALNSHWAKPWQYQPGFIDLECLVARQQLLQQQAQIPAPQQVQLQPQQLQPAVQQPPTQSSTPPPQQFCFGTSSSSP